MLYNIQKYTKIYKHVYKIFIYRYMKAKEIMNKYQITRNTLCNWVKNGLIEVKKTPSGRYIYMEKINKNNVKINN